jgi:hypothetical protein
MKWCALIFAAVAILTLSSCGNGGSSTSLTQTGGSSKWTWMSGADAANQSGLYGAQSIAASGNAPGSREQSISWIDSSGNFWLFGGNGYDSQGTNGFLNDLWKYDSGQWTWVGGPDIANQSGIYGTQGVASSSNVPGARNSEVRWLDSSGNLWLFGGGGYDANGTLGPLNDLWEYSSGQWTWMGGSNIANQSGVYGTQGQAAPNNIPGGRFHSVSWIDESGNFWLFGGNIQLNTGDLYLNDLWMYSGGQWTWMGGSSITGQPGVYGTQGSAAAGNIPGSREQAYAWTDSSGNFWLYGGNGYDSTGTYGFLNDLWEYSTTTGQWTWVSGSNLVNQPATYGTQGTGAAGNTPGARNGGMSWSDASGNFWLFGGYFHNQASGVVDDFNDLWEYSSGQWTWVSGPNSPNQSGTYGTLGMPGSSTVLGARHYSVDWVDSSGDFWIFGGHGLDSTGTLGYLNDLWRYEP